MHVSVCITTRNRGDSITSTLSSILNSTYKDFDIVILDQSSDDATQQAVQSAFPDDSRLTYIRSNSTGAARGRNIALQYASGPLIAFTDDDCEVPADWLANLVENFQACPDVGQICGVVLPGPHDSTQGFIPDYRIACRREIRSSWQKWREGGIGANMAFRLAALQAVGPFDEVLGPGSLLYNCEDGDMTYRVLKAGYTVLSLPDSSVIHHGFRTWEQGRTMMYRIGIAVAAAYMKHLRLGDLAILPTLLIEWARCVSWKRLLLLRPRSGLRRFLGFGYGLLVSFHYSIDSGRRIYNFPPTVDKEQIDHIAKPVASHEIL